MPPHLSIYCLSVSLYVWVSVCLYPINVKTAEPIEPKFCVGPHMTPEKVYGYSESQDFFIFVKF